MAIRTEPKPVQREQRPAEKIMEGLKEALAVAKGEAEPTAVHKRPGRPPSGKIMVTLRLDPNVIAKFKATGDGWQARMNEALRRSVNCGDVKPALEDEDTPSASG